MYVKLSDKVATKKVTINNLIDIAKGLKSEHGENPEYDRALAELITEAAGLPMDCKNNIAHIINTKGN